MMPAAQLDAVTARQPLGQLLIAQGVLNEDQLRIALLEQLRARLPLGQLLVQLGFIREASLREALAHQLGLPSIDLSQVVADAAAIALVPQELAKRHNVFPVALDRTRRMLVVAVADMRNLVALDQIRAQLPTGHELALRLAGETEIARAIERSYGHELSIDGILHEIETGEIDYGSLQATGDAYSQPVVRLVAALLADAVERAASDIHFEPEAGFLRIRYRIDGVLRHIRALHYSYWPAILVRLKVMAKMNIAETRAPQDGRISLSLSGRQVDFRVATHPTTHGENVVLRILERQKGIVPLDALGLDDSQLTTLRKMIARPQGMILITGPTGSGKTTTLYSILNHLNHEGVNIMTLEDPVEYPMPLIRQTSVNEAVKLDFAHGIRSLLRQDPDILLIGEIRDAETARMAFRAAMTGHQVYSTLHANSALGAIPRLLDAGLSSEIMAGNLIGILAQRLVRRLCGHCRQLRSPDAATRRLLNIESGSSVQFYEPQGCERCDHQGYSGRLALLELLSVDAELDALIARRAPLPELLRTARISGFRTLAEDGVRRVREGLTSLTELRRVVDLSEYQ